MKKNIVVLILAAFIFLGITTNSHAATFEEIKKLAEQGDADAQGYLGVMYSKGEGGVLHDYKKAIKWFSKAAEQGSATSQFLLGTMYESGSGVPKDFVQAYKWYNLSVAQKGMGRKNRDILAKEMTPEQVAEAQKLAREWKPKKQ